MGRTETRVKRREEAAAAESWFSGKVLVIRVDEASVAEGSTFVEDLQILAEAQVRPIVVAHKPPAAREIVRTINRSANTAVCLSGSDAAMLPQAAPGGIGRIQTGILVTLLEAGYVPVVEPTGFSVFANGDEPLAADDVTAGIAAAVDAVRAIFFHAAGGVADPATDTLIEQLTAAEALLLAEDVRVGEDLRGAIRAAAYGVRAGVGAAQIVDGRVPHAAVIELLTSQHVGTQVTSGITLAA